MFAASTQWVRSDLSRVQHGADDTLNYNDLLRSHCYIDADFYKGLSRIPNITWPSDSEKHVTQMAQ